MIDVSQCHYQSPGGELLGAKALKLVLMTNQGDDAQEVIIFLRNIQPPSLWDLSIHQP